MYSSQNVENDLILEVYSDTRTVYRVKDIAMLSGETNFISLTKKLNYYAHAGKSTEYKLFKNDSDKVPLDFAISLSL